MGVPAENFPFWYASSPSEGLRAVSTHRQCHRSTIDPSTSRVYVPDERFDFLQESFKPKSALRAFLEITDIAG